jgi:ribosomal protein L4
MVVDGLDLGDGKTKALVGLLARLGVAGVRTLVVVTERSDTLRRASRNVPWLTLVQPGQLTVAELLRHERLVFEPPALVAVQEGLGA